MSEGFQENKFLIVSQLVTIIGALICYYTSFREVGFIAIALGIIMVLHHFYLEVLKDCYWFTTLGGDDK